eukprot:4828442-Pyramimonas_sp.AAC.1
MARSRTRIRIYIPDILLERTWRELNRIRISEVVRSYPGYPGIRGSGDPGSIRLRGSVQCCPPGRRP